MNQSFKIWFLVKNIKRFKNKLLFYFLQIIGNLKYPEGFAVQLIISKWTDFWKTVMLKKMSTFRKFSKSFGNLFLIKKNKKITWLWKFEIVCAFNFFKTLALNTISDKHNCLWPSLDSRLLTKKWLKTMSVGLVPSITCIFFSWQKLWLMTHNFTIDFYFSFISGWPKSEQNDCSLRQKCDEYLLQNDSNSEKQWPNVLIYW